MPCMFEGVEGTEPWSVLLLFSSSLLQGELGGVGRSGFIGWDNEAPLDEALPDFMVEGEGY